MAIEIGVILPTSTADPARPVLGDVRASARRAEELGLDSVWSTDHLVPSGPMVDGTVVLATAAAVTERIRVGFNVMLLSLRPVAWAAKQIASLQYVSSGRLVLGVGTGNPAHGDTAWRAVGLPYRTRGQRTDEALRLLPGLVTGRPTTLADGVEVTLAPAAAMPPVLVAGNSARARARAAEFGDGWVSIGLTPTQVADQLRQLATDSGRDALPATVVAPSLSSDVSAAAAELAAYADAGTERVILPNADSGWERTYEHAAELRSALSDR
ncbi:MAG TPA: LLM class flavin-dependent oxidoreductase [Jatrophihabitantaceae bacterium]|jgi:alkanesulfonate monooxygenase SsuD/methylene tetrahydromethanopterin reductase-like flavin-dependent oxidoreductase (luciferase family)